MLFCPKCGSAILEGKWGLYCGGGCGINLKVYGKTLTPEQMAELLKGDEVYVEGFKSKAGHEYNAFVTMKGLGEWNGKPCLQTEMRFPRKDGGIGNTLTEKE